MQAKIDVERAELEATFREQVGDGSVTSPAGSMRVRENVERYLTGLTSSVIPGQPFEDERVKPETGKYTLAVVKVDLHELKGEPRGKRPPWRVTDAKGTVLALSKVGGEVVDQDLRNTKSVKGKYPVDSRAICNFCDGTHELEKSFKFRDKRYAQRKDFVWKQNLCENCLKPNHIARRCRGLGACLLSDCGERHHTLLHPPSFSGTPMGFGESGRTQTTSDQVNTNSSEANEESATGSPHHIEAGGDRTANSNGTRISLRIVPVRVSAKNGREVETYAFLDDGSDETLCLQCLVEELDVEGSPTAFALTTINTEGTQRLGEEVSLTVKALTSNE